MASRKTGIVCAVRGCHNNWYKRKIYLEQECFVHQTRTRAECGCEAPYDLYPPPKNEESLRLWLKALNLKKPPKRPYVCSFHFVHSRPTEDHPIPEKWLGYEVPIKNPRRRVKRLAETDDCHCDEEADPTVPESESPMHKDADTQWEVQALMDHTYTLGEKLKDVCDRETQCGGEEPLAHAILKNETSCVLYTGLSLIAFFDHVKFLEQFYKANFKMG
ncbi:uncharacterized protein [Pseudorasbora parva]|uniref:uncharacterized protein n=1 Tax=Pseudorasbora parva TaxID=51549 RepID=UPI00351EF96C